MYVRAASPDTAETAAGVADTPQAFVHWVASRPVLSAGPVRTTTLDGHRAWQVRVTLAPGRSRGPSLITITQPNGTGTGITGNQTQEYTAFRLPGAGTTVVESWTFRPNSDPLGTLNEVIHGLSWPAN